MELDHFRSNTFVYQDAHLASSVRVMLSRRQFLATAGTGLTASLAGCSAIPLPSKMNMLLSNHRNKNTSITIKLLHPDTTEYSEALVYDDRFELLASTIERSVKEMAPDRPYVVRVRTGRSQSYYDHYKPDCRSEDTLDPGVAVTLTPGDVRFGQARCSSNDPFF